MELTHEILTANGFDHDVDCELGNETMHYRESYHGNGITLRPLSGGYETADGEEYIETVEELQALIAKTNSEFKVLYSPGHF